GVLGFSTTTTADKLDDGTSVKAEITITDAAGNSASADSTESYVVDTIAPVLSITLDPNITPDDIINAAEATQNIPVSGTVGGEFKVGDTVTLTINGKFFQGLVLDTAGRFTIDVPGRDLALNTNVDSAGNKIIDASVTSTDVAGNSMTATDDETYKVDTTLPDLHIELAQNITDDDYINITEGKLMIPISGVVSGQFNVGDTVTLTINGTKYTGPVLDTLGKFTIEVNGADLLADPDKVIDASVTSTDAVGNTNTAIDTEGYFVDIKPPVDLKIELDPNITPDDIINAKEKGEQIPVSGKVSGEFHVGDTVTLTVNNKSFTGKVLDAEGHFTINVPGSELAADPDKTIDASVTSTDMHGNTDTATDTEGYGVDITAPNKPTVTIVTDELNDGILNRADIGVDANGKLNAQVQVQATVNDADFQLGGHVTLTIDDAGVQSTVVLTLNADNTLTASDGRHYSYDTKGTISWDEPTPADSKSLTVTATQTDLAGNTSAEATDTAKVVVPDAPTVDTHQYEVLAKLNFEDINLPDKHWRDDVDLNTVVGANTIGHWHANGCGLIEVGEADVYGPTTGLTDPKSHVLEIEGAPGVNSIYTDLELDNGSFYDLSFDIGARLENTLSCGLTVSLARVGDDTDGDGIAEIIPGSEDILYEFKPTSAGWVIDHKVPIGIDYSDTYRLTFKSNDIGAGDSYGALLDNIVFNKHENKGYANEVFDISFIEAALVDTDGSEKLTVYLSGFPAGTTIYSNHYPVDVPADGRLDITNLSMDNLQIVVGEPGTYTLNVEAIATEIETGESTSTVTDFTIDVLPEHVIPDDPFESASAFSDVQHDDSVLSATSIDDDLTANHASNNSDVAVNTVHAGLGNHILCGTQGADLFVWSQQDKPVGTMTKDIVTDFNHNQGDKLDLSALLDSNGTQGKDDMKGLLSVFENDEGVHLEIKDADTHNVTQEIVLADHSFDSLTGGMGSTATQVVDYMLNNHMLELHK
ncbi:MAG: Ig-like domain-containing protein, partial [Aeromonas sp.]